MEFRKLSAWAGQNPTQETINNLLHLMILPFFQREFIGLKMAAGERPTYSFLVPSADGRDET